MNYYKAFIRVVKSINSDDWQNVFSSVNIVEERLIEAENKEEVKDFLLNKYPQFFPDNKVFSKETKSDAQFFYVVIFELYEYEKEQISRGNWKCTSCGHIHENAYISRPRISEKLFGLDAWFCKSDDDYCIKEFLKSKNDGIEIGDDINYIKSDSPNYIYKCTEKSTGKCYIGKTRNAPFFRWWNHLQHSSSPFGIYLRKTKLSEWIFEVLEELPGNISDSEVFKIESKYILEFDSINNGFNSLISKKSCSTTPKNQLTLNVQPLD